MSFKCTKCKKEQEILCMFGKFTDNKGGMDDEGEYCQECFGVRLEKHGLKNKIEKEDTSCGIINMNQINEGVSIER